MAIPKRVFASLLIAGGFFVEVSMSLALLTGVADRLAALILAGYCLLTALLWKQFWTKPDFLKNAALAGGFLILAFGPNGSGVQQFLHHPLASSQPYATIRSGIQ